MAPSTITILPSFLPLSMSVSSGFHGGVGVRSAYRRGNSPAHDGVLCLKNRTPSCGGGTLQDGHTGAAADATAHLLHQRITSPGAIGIGKVVSQSAPYHRRPFPLPSLLCRGQRGTNIKSCLSITSPSPSLQASIEGARCWSACVVYRSTQHRKTFWI